MVLLTCWYSFLSSLYLSGKLVTRFIIMVLLPLWYFFLSSLFLWDKLVTLLILMVLLILLYSFLSSLYLYQASWWLYSSFWYYLLYDIFPQFSVLNRQVVDSTHHYGITLFMKLFPQFSVFIRQVGDSTQHYGITCFLILFPQFSVFIEKLLTLFIIMVLIYDILSSALSIYQESWWLYSSLWYYFIIFFKVGTNPGFLSIAQPSGFYWENPGFTRVILGFTG